MKNSEKFLKALKQYIFSNHGTQTAAAAHWGCSNNLVTLVVTGQRKPNEKMLSDCGYQIIETYKKVS